jgi:hypothetical protein
MKEILMKNVSRKDFLKISGGLLGTGLLFASGLGLFKNKKRKVGYSSGSYGGS